MAEKLIGIGDRKLRFKLSYQHKRLKKIVHPTWIENSNPNFAELLYYTTK